MQKEVSELERLRKENQELKDMIVNKMLLPKFKRPLVSQTERAFALMPENIKAALMRQTLEMIYDLISHKMTDHLGKTIVDQAKMEIKANYREWMENEMQKMMEELKKDK